jgi:hypothetical protein
MDFNRATIKIEADDHTTFTHESSTHLLFSNAEKDL